MFLVLRSITILLYSRNLYKSSAVAEMGDRTRAKWAEKWGLLCRFSWEERGPHHNIAWAEAYLRTNWNPDPSSRLATIGMGQKVAGCCAPLRGGGAEFLSNTMSPKPRPTFVPSGILIHPTVWPQYTNVTDRQDRQTGTSVR